MYDGLQKRLRTVVTDEIKATSIGHVINHGPSLREAGERVQPRDREHAIVGLVIADISIKLREIRARIVEDNPVF